MNCPYDEQQCEFPACVTPGHVEFNACCAKRNIPPNVKDPKAPFNFDVTKDATFLLREAQSRVEQMMHTNETVKWLQHARWRFDDQIEQYLRGKL